MQQTNIFTIINTKIQAQISPAVPYKRSFSGFGRKPKSASRGMKLN